MTRAPRVPQSRPGPGGPSGPAGLPPPFDGAALTRCVASASATGAAARTWQALLVPGLAGVPGGPAARYSFAQLSMMNGIRVREPGARSDIPVIGVDSVIAVNLAGPASNDSLVATPADDGTAGPGLRGEQGITVRYGLESVSVRRAPRYGPAAGTWTDLVTHAETGFSPGAAAPRSLTFAWDADSRAGGRLVPDRLLINSAAPYSGIPAAAARHDAEAIARDAGFPCGDEEQAQDGALPRPHVLDFEGGAQVGRMLPRSPAVLGTADLPEAAAFAQLEVAWDDLPGTLLFEAYDGAVLVAQEVADLHAAGSATLQLAAAATGRPGFSRLMLRVQGVKMDGPRPPAGAGISVRGITYLTAADVQRYLTVVQAGQNLSLVGPPGLAAGGQLAFLPDHDYEVVVLSTIAMGTGAQGTRRLALAEALYFRTRGLPGLNACASVGDDLRPHVASTYPLRGPARLYRDEPCALAFENSLSSVLPVGREPDAGDPPEKKQRLALELNIDRMSAAGGRERRTVPGDDWIVGRRPGPGPPPYVAAFPAFARARTRLAKSADPLVTRFEAARLAVAACGPPRAGHPSQVLVHEPIGADGTRGRWEADAAYRATVRQRAGPFTERSGFDHADLGALIWQGDAQADAAPWSVDAAGSLVAPPPGRGRSYAACGEPEWDHLRARAWIDLATAGSAGIAVGAGDGTPVPRGILATVEPDGGGHALVVRARSAAGERELGRAAVPVTGPFELTVTAYADAVRAAVGPAGVEVRRGPVREGRVALVARGPARFAGIAVTALDMYEFGFATSRFGSFAEHIGSYDGALPVLSAGEAAAAVARAAAARAALAAGAGPPERQRIFDEIAGELGIGPREGLDGVRISRLSDGARTLGLLVQSPEPIPVTGDVALTLVRAGDAAVPLVALARGDETAFLVLGLDGAPLDAGRYTLRLVLDRDRWAISAGSDPQQHYHDEAAITLQW
jgi:hypothetical protein